MATYEVTTWTELTNRIKNASSGDVIKIIADIDCNDEIPMGVTSPIQAGTNSFTVDGTYTENGVTKNRVIRNLRCTVTIFRLGGSGGSTTFKNIDFVNSLFDSNLAAVIGTGSQYSPTYLYLRNCRFSGERKHYLVNKVEGSSSERVLVYCYSCDFNLKYVGTSATYIPLFYRYAESGDWSWKSYAYYCHFKERYSGTYTPPSSTTAAMCGVSNTFLDGCRVDGEIVGNAAVVLAVSGVVDLGAPSLKNVYDLNIKLTTSNTSTTVTALPGVFRVPITNKNNPTVTYTISSQTSGTLAATESQMKDAQWLSEHNFPVVVSSV